MENIFMSNEVVLIIGYIVGTVVGIMFGFDHGIRKGANATIDMMIKNNFVKWRKVKDDIILLKIDQ